MVTVKLTGNLRMMYKGECKTAWEILRWIGSNVSGSEAHRREQLLLRNGTYFYVGGDGLQIIKKKPRKIGETN